MNVKRFSYDCAKARTKTIENFEKKNKKNFKDDRFYYPQIKDDGTAEAIIRFLPPKFKGETQLYDLPYVEFYKHSFLGSAGWFIQDCPKTIKKDCPVCEDVSNLYNIGDKRNGSQRFKKVDYIVNILVIKDPQNPENNGKVFLYRFGKKIWEKICGKWCPKPDSIDEPLDIWSYYEGANFKLKIKRTAKDENGKSYPDYSTSEWCAPSSLSDEIAERCNEQMVDLNEFLDPSRFKSYDDLKENYLKKVGVSGNASSLSDESYDSKEEDVPIVVNEEEVEEDDDFFNRLRNENNFNS